MCDHPKGHDTSGECTHCRRERQTDNNFRTVKNRWRRNRALARDTEILQRLVDSWTM